MSTLNSSQLCVKRSSTRLHAPPGGRSTLSFGPGGFGTTDAGADVESEAVQPSEPVPCAGYGYLHPGNNQADGGFAPFNAIKAATPHGGSYAPAVAPTRAPASSYGAPASSHGYAPQQPPPSSSYSLGAYAEAHRPASTQSNFSWGEQGAQPPLTSSKRDQNWEKKRRLWLARKNGGGPSSSASSTRSTSALMLPMPPPPMAHFGYEQGDPCDAHNPPSPLTKFMAQQLHAPRPQTQQEPEYDHLGTVRSGYSDHAYGRPPSSSAMEPPTGYREERRSFQQPPGTAQSFASGASYSSATRPAAGGYYGHTGRNLPPGTSSGSEYVPPRAMPGTAASTASFKSRAGSRQPPGGQSNWSPYS